MPPSHPLLSGRLLAGNVVWSLAGAGLPLLIGLWAIPELVTGLGKERFGLLAIIWMGIGYFSLFDLGIGRALTKLVAERLGTGEEKQLPQFVRVSLNLMWLLGVLAAAMMMLFSQTLIDALQVPSALQAEARWSLWILSAALPFVVSTAGLIGILQAYQRFRAITAVRLPLGIANFVGPVLVLHLTTSLTATTIVLAASRVAAWLAYVSFCKPHRRIGSGETTVSKKEMVLELFSFGGWITISNALSPIMVYFDRLLIGSVLGLVAVAYYTTPYEILTRLWIVPGAVADVVFPALAVALGSNLLRAKRIYASAMFVQGAVMFPVIVLLTLYASELLNWWIGEELATHSASVLRWLALGVYINCFARMPYVLLQGDSRPDITAKLHLLELPLYGVTLWWMLRDRGIEGAAIAWTARMTFDAVMLFFLAAWHIRKFGDVQYVALLGIGVTSSVIVSTWAIEMWPLKVAAAVGVLIGSLLVVVVSIRLIPRGLRPGVVDLG